MELSQFVEDALKRQLREFNAVHVKYVVETHIGLTPSDLSPASTLYIEGIENLSAMAVEYMREYGKRYQGLIKPRLYGRFIAYEHVMHGNHVATLEMHFDVKEE